MTSNSKQATKVKLITWNVGGRVLRLGDQIKALARQEADVVCLQEVRASTVGRWRESFGVSGLGEVVDSSGRSGGKLFNLTASRWPTTGLDTIEMRQPERLLSVRMETEFGPFEVHNLHVPPVRDREGTRVETMEATYRALAGNVRAHRVLCGDLNTARVEFEEPDLGSLGRVAMAEHRLLRGLERWDLTDVFRRLHGYERGAVTRSGPGHHRMTGHRLDHILASEGLCPVFCEYQDGWRQEGMSDHSAMEAIFEPRPAP